MSRKTGQPHKGWKDAAAYSHARGKIPVVGGIPETYACAYVVGCFVDDDYYAVRLGACLYLERHVAELQSYNPLALHIEEALWFPDLPLAQRVAKEGRKHLSFPIQGSWFTVGDTWEAGHALRTAATHLKIPALTTKQYLSICRTPQQIKNAAIDSFLR